MPIEICDCWLEWSSNIDENFRMLWNTHIIAFYWMIWKEINERIFNSTFYTKKFILNSIVHLLSLE